MNIEYKIVTMSTTGQLQVEVQKLLNEGWQLTGGVTFHPTRNAVSQSMFKTVS